MAAPIIYMIRHGEKLPKEADGKDAHGLSIQGLDRAQGLRKVFGANSQYNISYILAEKAKKDGSRARPYNTVAPLASDLGLTINSSISRDDVQGAAKAAKAYAGPGNVLICWEHGQLAKIADALGVKGFAAESGETGKVEYPDDRFDLIWTVPWPYEEIVKVNSESMPGLDDGKGRD